MIKIVASVLLLAASAFAGTPYAYNSILPGGSVSFTSGVVAAAPAYAAPHAYAAPTYAAAPAFRAFAPAPAVRAFAPAPVAYAAPAAVKYHAPAPIAYAAPAVAKVIQPEPFDPNPQYQYAYSVSDALTGDQKSATETRNGDAVSGQYSLVEPDGAIRTVTYTADSLNGFQAVVDRTRGAVAVAPVAKVAAPVFAARSPYAHYAGAPAYAAPAYASPAYAQFAG